MAAQPTHPDDRTDVRAERQPDQLGGRAQKIVPFLWFDGPAEEAMHHYVSIFPNSRVLGVTRYGDAGPGPKGSAMAASFLLDGQELVALNGGPPFKFREAVSFVVTCTSQEEVDDLWAKLSAGGEESQCGWLKDRFGLSWQIIPRALGAMLQGPDPARSSRVMQAMLQMRKIDTAGPRRAKDGQDTGAASG